MPNSAMQSFGEGAYYGDPNQGHRDAWLTDDPRLREHLPSDTQKRVERAYKQWNRVLRNRLGSETRLRLKIDDDQIAIPVKIVDGLPAPFANVIREFDPDLWWLTAHRTMFSVTQTGVAELARAAAISRPLVRASAGDEDIQKELHRVATLLSRLLETKELEDFDEALRQINQDVLGAYFFYRSEVHLYWMVIGFYAARLGVQIEDLTIVVLTHELAHAYTHLGADIDGTCWDTNAFAATDLRIVEGLAQLYTETVVDRLAESLPGAKIAFNALLKKQSEPYTIFKQWIDPSVARGEIIRTAMIQTRTTRNTKYEIFRDAIERRVPSGIGDGPVHTGEYEA
jgi:hypothetical protein